MSIGSPSHRAPVPLETIAAALLPFRTALSEEHLRAIQVYLSLLLEWNKSVNLTAIDDPIEILSRHFGESLFAASFLKIGASRMADVGTGPGFPGLPLKIVSQDMQLVLFESNLKKCAFLTEAVQRLRLTGVNIVKQRHEEAQTNCAKFDYVCSRALGGYPVFLPWAHRALNPGGHLVLWLGTAESIRLATRKEFTWDAPVLVPESRSRVILVGRSAV